VAGEAAGAAPWTGIARKEPVAATVAPLAAAVGAQRMHSRQQLQAAGTGSRHGTARAAGKAQHVTDPPPPTSRALHDAPEHSVRLRLRGARRRRLRRRLAVPLHLLVLDLQQY
jgi:hypothetical protein